MNAAHAPIFDFLVHIMLVRRSKTLIFLYFQKLRYLTSAFDRPGFQRMIADIEKGRINLVITKDLSRLGRNYIMCGQYTEIYFPERHVRYIALNDGVDTLNQTSSMDITPFKHILNDMYAKDISTKIKSTLHTKARRGEYLGALDPYGYLRHPDDKHKLIIIQEM